ncbi:hypothetical protein [Cytobacillus praedii]|uniref:hypothetical protein n=1 Tax=Cytobacillus praedii TaxID=1742358 RepID=UPI002E1D2779|nr:hypothetical protein [Cytobacillus praedii]
MFINDGEERSAELKIYSDYDEYVYVPNHATLYLMLFLKMKWVFLLRTMRWRNMMMYVWISSIHLMNRSVKMMAGEFHHHF